MVYLNSFFSRPAIERPGLESQRSRKCLFFTERFSNSLIPKNIQILILRVDISPVYYYLF